MDIRRIPILSLSSTISMTDLMSELPLPIPHADSLNQSLWYNQDVFNEAYKILNSNNNLIFESIAVALSNTTTDEIILKESSETSGKLNLNAVPAVFRQMVTGDRERFKHKIGFQEFFVKESGGGAGAQNTGGANKPAESVNAKEKTEKSSKKKKKKRKEVSNVKENAVQNESDAYSISHKSNGLCFSFKKIKPPLNDDPKSLNVSNCPSLPNTIEHSLNPNPNLTGESNTTNPLSSISVANVKNESSISFANNNSVEESFNNNKHITGELKPKDNITTIKEEKASYKPVLKHCNVDENYFVSITGLNHSTDVFNSKSIFESDVTSLQVIDSQNSKEDFLDSSGFKSNPHSNSLSTHELQLNDSNVKNNILGIDYNRSDLTNNSPLHDDSQSYQQNNQHFGLAAYLTKTTNSNNQNNTNSANNTDNQPGSCLSAGQNSFDNYDLKNSDASISESANANGPNSAFSEIDMLDRKMEKRSRGRNKELENLKRWQILEKGATQTDDILDSATVGPGERVKKRTRRCVKRNEREDCSSMSEHSYHTTDISPAAPETAQINHSESSLDDENRLSPTVTQSSPFESNSELFNNLPLKENAQSKSAMEMIAADLNFNSTDMASSLASVTPDEDLPEVMNQSKAKIKGKKIPSQIESKISGKSQTNDSYNVSVSQGPLPVEIMGDISDESSDDSSSNFSAKCKSKPVLNNNKRTKKSKNSYYKPNSNSESRFHHLFSNKEQKVLSRDRIFRASQYTRNMNPVVVLSPLPDDIGYHNLNSPTSSNTPSTLPFNGDLDLDILTSEGDLIQYNSGLSKHSENIKSQFFNFLDSLLKDVEELDLLSIASNNKKPNVLGSFGYNEHDAKLSSDNLNLLNIYVSKMKSYKMMNQVPVGKLVRLLALLLVNMNNFIKVPNDTKKKVQKILQEQLLSCLDASLIALSIMISPDMPRAVFLEEVIEQACDLLRTVMRHIIYPIYDSSAKCQTSPNDVLMNIISNLVVNKSQSNFLSKLYPRVQCGINCLSELMHQQPSRLTDEAVLKLTSLAISSLSVNVEDIQFGVIPLLAAAFSQYEGHRKSIIGELLSIMTHSQGKKIIRTYKINSQEEIQTISAVIVILFHSVVQKPKSNKKSHSNKQAVDSDVDQSVISAFNSSHRIMQIFIHTFFKKVCFKGEDNYKVAFERFLQDLFLIYNKPEWPGVNSLMNCIGTTLVYHLNTSQTNRTVAIDLLGTICSFMYKNIGIDNYKSRSQNTILKELIVNISKNSQVKVQSDFFISMSEDEQIRLLKYLLLNFLTIDSSDSTCMYSKRYYVGLWLHELYSSNENNNQGAKKDSSISQGHLFSKYEEEYKKILLSQLLENSDAIFTNEISELSYENAIKISRLLSLTKDLQCFELYLSRICKSLDENSVPARTKAIRSLTLVLEEDPSLLMKNEIEKSVNRRFLDSAISVREATVDLIGKFLMQKPELINQYYPVLINRIIDTGTSVRKRVIKALWDICSSQHDFKYSAEVYAKIMKRMYDEESIKKLVNEVFKSIWFSPISDKDPVKLQQRIFSIADVIHSLGHDQKCNHNWVLQFITQLSKSEKENTDAKSQKSFEKSYQQIVEFLVQTVLRLQDVSSNSTDTNPSSSLNSKSVLSSHQKLLCSTWSALHIFTKVRPKLIWPYLSELSVLLRQIRSIETGSNLKQTLLQNNDMAICMNHLCGTLDAGLSAIQSYENLEYSNINLTKDSLNDIANDLINLATNAPKRFIVDSVIKCLSKVTCFTQEFSSVRNFFTKFFGSTLRLTDELKQNPKQWKIDSKSASLCRILYTSVVLCRFFEMHQLLNENMLSQANSVFSRLLDITIYCAENFPKNCELSSKAIFNMNHLVHKDRHLLINGPIQKFYLKTLNLILEDQNLSNDASRMITCILDNISNFLKHNELKMVEENSNWKSRCQNESLKESNDISGSFGNVVAQIYFKLVLECCLVGRTEIRLAGLNLVCKILSQGLVQPSMSIPYLIALEGDVDNTIKFKAGNQLTELNSKFPVFLNMKAILGIRLSYKLQNSISKVTKIDSEKNLGNVKPMIRGWTYLNGNPLQTNVGEPNSVTNILAVNHQLYSSLRRVKQQWRGFLDKMVNMFDESQQCEIFEQIFIADQLATFPYQIQEEPIFVVHKLEMLISVVGPMVLKSCKDVFKQLSKPIADRAYKDGELTPNEMTILVKLLSESTFENKHIVYLSIKTSKVSSLMMALKDYIKNIYGIIDSKITNYSPDNNSKQWEKQVSRNTNSTTFEIPQNCLIVLPDEENLKSTDTNINFVKELIIEYIEFRNKLMHIDPKIKNSDSQNNLSNLNDSKIENDRSKSFGKSKSFESKSDIKPSSTTDNYIKAKSKVVRAETQSDSDISNSTSSDSVKIVTPKKQKIAYSSNNRIPIPGKEIPNLDVKTSSVNTEKTNKLSNDNRKSISNSNVNINLNGKLSKPKSTDKTQTKVTLTSLPSDFLGAYANNKSKPYHSKSFKTSTNNPDNNRTPIPNSKSYPSSIKSDHINSLSDKHYSSSTSTNTNLVSNKYISKSNDSNYKRPASPVNLKKPKKRKRMISSSSDSDPNSD